jgi:hypothetical protein
VTKLRNHDVDKRAALWEASAADQRENNMAVSQKIEVQKNMRRDFSICLGFAQLAKVPT